jgi:hypothetical protein
MAEKPTCPHCFSDNVLSDASARWDVDAQEWVIVSECPHGHCCNCESDLSRFNWMVPLEGEV